MQIPELTTSQTMLIGAGTGFILGLVPLILGFVKKNRKYGAIGFVLSIIGGGVLGAILAIPVSIVFSWLVLRKPKSAEIAVADENSNPVPVENVDNL
jgi:hypothetical protein